VTAPASNDTAAPAGSDTPPQPTRHDKLRAALRLAGKAISTGLLAVTLVLFAALAVGPHLAGYRTETMLTASMRPLIRPGDVAVDTAEPLTAVRVGQIITYRIPTQDHRVVSHRVIALTRTAGGGLQVRTKGDANTTPDQWTAQLAGQQVWRVRAVIPHLGRLIGLLRGPALAWLLRAAAAVFALEVLLAIWRRPSPDRPEQSPT